MNEVERAHWHLPDRAIASYTRVSEGQLDPGWASSVEAHLDACAQCRARLVGDDVPQVLLRVGAVLRERIGETPQYRRPARRRRRLMAGQPLVWLLAALGVEVVAGLFDAQQRAAGGHRPFVLLLLAPVLPLVTVAAAWIPAFDPLRELRASAPSTGLLSVIRRAWPTLCAVILISLLVSTLDGSASPARWLLPCLSLAVVTLAMGSVVRLDKAAFLVASLWCVAVVVPALSPSSVPAPLDASAAPVWVLVMLLAAGVTRVRHDAYQRLSSLPS